MHHLQVGGGTRISRGAYTRLSRILPATLASSSAALMAKEASSTLVMVPRCTPKEGLSPTERISTPPPGVPLAANALTLLLPMSNAMVIGVSLPIRSPFGHLLIGGVTSRAIVASTLFRPPAVWRCGFSGWYLAPTGSGR
ncbi:MAG: hypothetical protein HW397_538 [Dehalococcoidia bacterium]|nr:hypothetical protein [Dehalococcoidia bacterium]